MAQKPHITEQATLRFLQDRHDGEVSALTLLKGGEWSQAYSFEYRGKKYVLRWCHSSETFEKDAFASRFRSSAMPVPVLTATGMAFDTHFAISEFVEGKFIDNLTADELDRAMPALLRLFDALRTADLTGTTGYGGWDKDGIGSHASWKDYLLSVNTHPKGGLTSNWHTNLANSGLGLTDFEQLYAQFVPLVEKVPEQRELIHSDLLNFNLLVSGEAISGVIDWQCGIYGDALYDVAWYVFYAPWYPQFVPVQLCQRIVAHAEATATDPASVADRLLCYQFHIGLGSITYNAFKQDWKVVQDYIDYLRRILHETSAG